MRKAQLLSYKDNIRKDLEAKGAAYFDKNYAKDTTENYLRRLRRQHFLEYLSDAGNGCRVLDAGCGPAILFPELLEKALEYVAVDLVSANLEEITRKTQRPQLTLIEADMDKFCWQQDYFDIIICSGAIEYMAEPERVLLKLVTLLKNGGILVCSFPNKASPYRLWGEFVYKRVWQVKNIILNKEYFLYPRQLFSGKKVVALIKKLLEPRDITINYFGHKFLIQPLDYPFRRLDSALTMFFQRHPVRWSQCFCTEFVLCLKK
jgi:2-polyprenyl-3-methyl-5-hydroxy-6-metoxy-1,4-benzoquinol methylase